MQDTTSQGASQGEAQGRRKLSPAVAGIGAAMIATCVTLVVMMSNPGTTTSTDQAASTSKSCPAIQRRLLVSTEHGGGTIQFRASGWVSQKFTLSTKPQVVIFPLLRSETVPVAEAITVEGDATDVVVTSEVTDLHKVFDVKGTYPYPVTWAPKKGC